jgi:hypothetical protein
MGRDVMPKQEFAKILKALAALYPKYELHKETLSAYYAVLADIPPNLLKAATLQIGATSKWFPAASELREAAFGLVDRANGKISAEEAWGQVIREMRNTGLYREPNFDDPMVYRAIEATGGWRVICVSPEDMLGATRSRFIQAFKRMRQDEQMGERMLTQVREVTRELSFEKTPMLGDGDGIQHNDGEKHPERPAQHKKPGTSGARQPGIPERISRPGMARGQRANTGAAGGAQG